MTTLILTHESALAFWRSPASGLAQAALQEREIGDALEDVTGKIRASTLAAIRESGRLGQVSFPLELLTATRGDRRSTKLMTLHCMQTPIPAESLRFWKGFRIEGQRVDLLVSSPEFCFVQMTRRLSDIEALMLACELCGSYRLSDSDPRGYVHAEPLTQPAWLEWYANEARQMTGAKQARRLATHALSGARSPQQAKLALMASLPRSLGGIGTPAPELDHVIEVPDDVARVLGSRTRTPDLFWPQVATALELDTRSWANAGSRADYEERKADAYRRMGITLITLSRAQLGDLDALRRLFEVVARSCGKRRHPVNERQAARQEATHRVLFGE